MTTEYALAFLRQYQPFPPAEDASDALFLELDMVLKHFSRNHDDRCVPLLLNMFGEGDGQGVYQRVEDTLSVYPDHIVIAALKNALSSRSGSITYWAAQIAANYPVAELADPLILILREGDIDEQLAAVTALEGILSPDVRQELEGKLKGDVAPEVRELIEEILEAKTDDGP